MINLKQSKNSHGTGKLIKISAVISSLLLLVVPIFVFAQITNPLGEKNNSIPALVHQVMGYIVQVGGTVAIFAFIYSGFLFVQARGNPTKLEDARKTFVNICIGVAILLGAQVIATIVTGTIESLGK